MTATYYNEIDPYACTWLRNLCNAGHINHGTVLENDIRCLSPDSIRDAARVHFFAGIGLWDYALRLAEWPDDRPVWTGSCPCQPFSRAGRGAGLDDERHLWPEWFRLIRECRPPVVFGEQVAGSAGRAWLDVVSADLEAEGYSVGAADLCAASVGAPHIRQRLYFVAHANRQRQPGIYPLGLRPEEQPRAAQTLPETSGSRATRIVGDTSSQRSRRLGRTVPRTQSQGCGEREEAGGLAHELELAGYTRGFWAKADWISCRDGKSRPIEPGTFPLAHGHPRRMAVVRPGGEHWYAPNRALQCIGNAIVPQVAATFIQAAQAVIANGEH